MTVESFKDMPQWALALAFPIVAILLIAIKRVIYYFLKQLSRRTQTRWDDVLLASLNFSVTLLIVAGLSGFIPVFFALPERWEKFAGLASKLIAVLAVGLFVQKVLLGLQKRYMMREERLKTYSGMARVLITIGVYSVFALIFLDSAGISVTPLIASLGVGGIAVALALQDTLANFFSGVYVLVDQPIRVGDYVQVGSDVEGYVESIGWRSVRILRLQNNAVIIPNSKLAGSIITNFDMPEKELAVLVQVGVDYGSDLEKVEKVTIEVGTETMKTVAGGVPRFQPFIRYHTFGDSSINFTVILRGNDFVSQYLIKHEFIKRLHRRYNQEGITIPFPIRTVHMVNDQEGA